MSIRVKAMRPNDFQFNNGEYPQEYNVMPLKELRKELEHLYNLRDAREPGWCEVASDHDIWILINYIEYRIKEGSI